MNSHRAWRRAALPVGLFVAGFGSTLAWQLTRRPEPPGEVLAQLAAAWNVGLDEVVRESGSPRGAERLAALERDGALAPVEGVDAWATTGAVLATILRSPIAASRPS